MKKLMYILIFVAVNLSFTLPSVEQTNHLFKIGRSKDANEIFYDIDADKKGSLNMNNPIHIYWIRFTEGAKIKQLTWIQKKYAYGLNYDYISEQIALFNFVSYDKKKFLLKKGNNGEFKVFTNINDKYVIVNRIFIQIDGGSFWFPKISEVELHTQEPNTGKNIIEIIHP